MVRVWWCHVGALIKGKLWMKYVHTGLYSASSWPRTPTANCLPPSQVLPAGDGHGEHLTLLSKSCQGAETFSRHGTTVLTPKETMWMVVGMRHCLDSVSSHYSLSLSSVASYSARQQHMGLSVWWTPVVNAPHRNRFSLKTLTSVDPKYSLYRLHMNDNTWCVMKHRTHVVSAKH